MLFVVLFFLIISSIAVFFMRRDRQSMLILGLCVSFVCMFTGIIIYLSKTGGLQSWQKFFLFFDTGIQRKLSYMVFPLRRLGYMIAIGRTLFPGFLLMLAFNYSLTPWIKRHRKKQFLIWILPVVTLVLYYPSIFLNYARKSSLLQILLINITILWIALYLGLSLLLLLYEYRNTTIPYCKKQFRSIMGFLICMGIMYFFYFRQDPIQVYQMYSAEYMRYGGPLYSGTAGGGISRWIVFTGVTTVFGILGFWNLRSYTLLEQEEAKGDIRIQKKFDTASKGISVFVHGMKNQLLSNRILMDKLNRELEKEQPEQERLQNYAREISQINANMLTRMEELYRSVKSNYITLEATEAQTVVDMALSRFHDKYPGAEVKTIVTATALLLADRIQLSEALYNLLTNGYESILEAGRKEPELEILAHDERLYVTFEISDNGTGMSRQVQRKIYDPFYTSKNTNQNWGMGLHYVRQIIRNHLGMLRLESTEGKGTRFFVAIPKYEDRSQ